MENAIKKAIHSFEQLLPIEYDLIVARKGKIECITIYFSQDHFYHLCGFQHFLMDTYMRTASRQRIYQDILTGQIDTNVILDRLNSSDAEARISCVASLGQYLDADELVLRWDGLQKSFSRIRADYLVDARRVEVSCYIFLEKDKTEKYYCKSMFPSADDLQGEYIKGLSKYTLLYRRKRNLKTGETSVQYDSKKLTTEQKLLYNL